MFLMRIRCFDASYFDASWDREVGVWRGKGRLWRIGREKGFTQIVADQGADERRFLVERLLFGDG